MTSVADALRDLTPSWQRYWPGADAHAIATDAESRLDESVALAHWSSTGAAVELLDRRDDGMTLLLKRLRPAGSLDDLPFEEQLVVAGGLVRRLHAAGQPPAAGLPARRRSAAAR